MRLRSDYDARAHGARCDLCPLKHKIPVPPRRARKPLKLAIVGEGPGHWEEVKGQPFVGPSGRMMDVIFKEEGIDRREIHVTNAALCKYDHDADLPIAIACCAPRLGRELGALPIDVPILTLGAKAIRPILGKGAVLRTRGFVWKTPTILQAQVDGAMRELAKKKLSVKRIDPAKIKAATYNLQILKGRRELSKAGERTVFVTVHPMFLQRGADQWTPVFRLDCSRAIEWAKKGPFPLEDEEPYVETHTPKRAEWFLKKMGPIVCLDIETGGDNLRNPLLADITCIGISDEIAPGVGRTVVLSPWHAGLVPVLNACLETRTALGHNIVSFDKLCCEKHGIIIKRVKDSLVGHHAFAGHLPQSLAHVGSAYCKIGPWKAKFKEGEKGLANFNVIGEELAKYNAADVRINIRSWFRMQEDLAPESKVYEMDMRVAEMCANMQRVGIAVDDERRIEVALKLRRKARRLITKMRSILRWKGFEPAKTAHIRRALYGRLKIPVNEDLVTKTGLPSTAKALLEAYTDFDTRAGRFCQAVLDWRGANDTVSEYLDGEAFRKTIINGRVHASWRSFGTEVGRPATHQPNILNMPRIVLTDKVGELLARCKTKEERAALMERYGRNAYDPATRVREIYVAREGHVFVYFDLSQSQMRQAAHLSGDENFMAACKEDVHTANACVLFPAKAELLRKDPKGAGKIYRDIMKNIGFAIIFLAEEDKVYLTLLQAGFRVSMTEVRAILNRIHSTYRRYVAYVHKNQQECNRTGYLYSPYLRRIRRMGHIAKPTTIANYPIISGEADCMMLRLLEIEDQRPASSPLVFWGYDSAIYECPIEEVGKDPVTGAPTGVMADIIKRTWARPITVPHNGIQFVQPIDFKMGYRLSDL